jgi:hypothetical protein
MDEQAAREIFFGLLCYKDYGPTDLFGRRFSQMENG